ncbi:Rap1a/Tai family immunity protein [Mesorhizobium sp. M0025]|uniref:Rap1a/Tai family immunity protein n=1 Tax=Mesorhizobium sp. M0025 TaxID=2956846 RepID=UPI003335E408
MTNCDSTSSQSAQSLCLGYIAGVADTMIQVHGSDASTVGSCPSEDPTPSYGAYLQIFKNWAPKHPEKWGEPMFAGVRDAIQEMWPCQ